MHPDLFKIGPITIHTYGVFVALGIFCAVFCAMRLSEKEGISPSLISDLCFWIILGGVLGARITYVIANISYYIRYPLEIVEIWKGGLIFAGGLMVSCLVLGWHVRKYKLNFWKVGDILAPSAALGQAIGRIGCFMAGCCYGKPTDLPWAVVFHDPHSLAPLNIPLHPTEIYHSIACFTIFFVLMILRRNKSFEGKVFLWYLILHSFQRLLIEKFRGDLTPFVGNLTITQLSSLIIMLTSVIILILKKKELK